MYCWLKINCKTLRNSHETTSSSSKNSSNFIPNRIKQHDTTCTSNKIINRVIINSSMWFSSWPPEKPGPDETNISKDILAGKCAENRLQNGRVYSGIRVIITTLWDLDFTRSTILECYFTVIIIAKGNKAWEYCDAQSNSCIIQLYSVYSSYSLIDFGNLFQALVSVLAIP